MGLFLSDELGVYSWGDWVLQWPIVCGKVMEGKCLMSGIMVGVVERHRFQWMNGAFERICVHGPWFSGTTDTLCTWGPHTHTWSWRHSKLQNGLMFKEHLHVFKRQSYIAEEWWSDLRAIRRFVTSTSGTASITQHQHLSSFFCLFSSTPDLALQSRLGLDGHHCLLDLASPCTCWGALHGEQASCN